MATEDPKTDPPADPPEDPPADPTDPPEDPPADPPDDVDPEVAKAIKRRDAAVKRAQKAEDEAQALRDKYEKDKTDPLAQANARLVKAEARTVLTGAGVEKADQAAVMGYLNLTEISVSTDGEVDTEAIQDAVDELKRIFGKKAPEKRTPRIDPRDKGGDGAKPTDPANERRKAMLGF